jgi:GH18 family chitinase
MFLAGIWTACFADFIVLGYAPSWGINTNTIRYEMYTHINYAFVLPSDGNGNLGNVPSSNRLRSIVEDGHASGVKVCISVGGWNDGDDSNFEALAANADSRTRFVNALMDMVHEYNLDGVDMDWEYPDEGTSADNYTLMMGELGDTLHKEDKILTAAVVGGPWNGEGIQDTIFEILDFINLMAYDSPDHSTMEEAETSITYWIGRGLAPEKTVLGLPFYGRNGQGSYVAYNDLISQDPDNAYRNEYNGHIYNGVSLVKEKTATAIEQGGGVMFWEMTQDTFDEETSLLVAIHQAMDSLIVPVMRPKSGAIPSAPGHQFIGNRVLFHVLMPGEGYVHMADVMGRQYYR